MRPRSRAATSTASGSPKTSAAMAEASTTLTVIPVRADHGGGFGWSSQPEALDRREKLVGAQALLGPYRFLEDGQKLALKRPMIAARPLAQAPDDLVRRILDGQIDRH